MLGRSLPLALAVFFSFAGTGCRTLTVGRADDSTTRAARSRRFIAWSASRRLTWSDYLAPPLAGPAGNGASTALSLIWGFRCTEDRFDFRVVTAFYPDISWVGAVAVTEPDVGRGLLQHEQLHFDLAEVYARMMRRFFSTLDRPCDRPTADLTALGDQFVKYEADAQKEYDEESVFGRQAVLQAQWEEHVEHTLGELGSFAPEGPSANWQPLSGGLLSGH